MLHLSLSRHRTSRVQIFHASLLDDDVFRNRLCILVPLKRRAAGNCTGESSANKRDFHKYDGAPGEEAAGNNTVIVDYFFHVIRYPVFPDRRRSQHVRQRLHLRGSDGSRWTDLLLLKGEVIG